MSFTVYRSSAGSGKTFTLVKEYLKIILQDTDSFRNILAVTFTNKAAAEMKHRVLRYLEELANPPIPLSEHLLAALINDTGLSETEIRFKAAGALKKILHHYSDFAIGTIDSFSHRIIRAFAHDFGLPVNFEVELDSDKLIETAVDLLLDKVGDDEPLTALLVNFLESKMEDDKSWAIDKTLVNFSRLLLDEESQQHLLKLRALSADDFKTIALFLRKKIRDFGKSVSDEASVARNVIREAGLGHQAFANGRYGISWYFEQIASGRYDKIIPSSKISGMVSKDSWHSNKATSAEKSAIESIRPVLLETYEKLQSLIATSYPAYTLYTLLETSIYPLAVLNSIDRIMQEFKKQNNIIHISEFNSRIASIVLFEPVPFIYERIGEKYHHVLIDEFQDTSALQWQNFVPLIENSLASGYFNLVVGDGKQAIYRWRNGDVEQFTALPALKGSNENPVIRDREEALDRNFQEELLNRNFRSKQEIVSFNNDFFGFIIGFLDESLAKVYAGLTQEADSAKEGGYIRISFIDKGDEEAVAADQMLKTIIEIITDCRNDGYTWKDIAILCRKNKEASLIARTLIENSIPVISGESLLLNYSSPVRMLTGLVSYLYKPFNPIVQAEILNHYCECEPACRPFYYDWLNMASADEQRTKLFDEFLSGKIGRENISSLKTLPAYDLFIILLRSFCPASANDPYIQFLLNSVLKFTSEVSSSATDFLEWWEERKEKLSVVMPSGFNAVQVMTIHKAKGLQFPVVVYPFAEEKLETTRSFLWVGLQDGLVPKLTAAILPSIARMEDTDYADQYNEERQKSMLDLVNLLYVAMTRPEERLYILPPRPSKSTGEPKSIPSFLKSFLLYKNIWEDGRDTYEFGWKRNVNPDKKEGIGVFAMPDLTFGDWREKIRIRSRAPEIWNLDDPDKNRRFGNVLHTILARLNMENTADDVIRDMLENGLLDKGWEDEIRSKISAVLRNPELAFIFDANADVRPEAEILTADGHSLRPDRVIIQGNEAIIVDYKTGRPEEKYKNQLQDYAKRLNEMGYQDVQKYLLYLEPDIRLEKVI